MTTDPQEFRLSETTVAALSEAVAHLGADLNELWGRFNRQRPEWQRSQAGAEVAAWLELMDNLSAVMEDAEHAPGRDAGTGKEPPATDSVTGGSFPQQSVNGS